MITLSRLMDGIRFPTLDAKLAIEKIDWIYKEEGNLMKVSGSFNCSKFGSAYQVRKTESDVTNFPDSRSALMARISASHYVIQIAIIKALGL